MKFLSITLCVAALVGCKSQSRVESGSRFLSIDFVDGEQAGKETTIAQAYETVVTERYYDDGGGLGLADGADLSSDKLSKLLDETVKVAFGHADGQKAHVMGKIMPCADAPGKVARTFPAGHLCYVTKETGNENLALLPCGSLEKPDEACFDVTEFMNLYKGTFLKPKDAALAAHGNEYAVDTRFDRLENTKVIERRGKMTVGIGSDVVASATGIEVLQFENVAAYASGVAAAKFQAFQQKGRGLVGFQYYENAGDPKGGAISLTNSGEPFPENDVAAGDAANPFDVLQASFAVVP